ncbi:MAG: hypothetical protein U0325_36580 [Polyangiales bacterium]
MWRIPPTLDGHTHARRCRAFTALTARERAAVGEFFRAWSRAVARALRPGEHVFLAGNAFLSQLVFGAVADWGPRFRGELIRLVRTLRGGDRPKNAEAEFAGRHLDARGCYELGDLSQAAARGMTVGECLRAWQTGALRRTAEDLPSKT